MEKIIITRRELIRQIPADLSEHDRTVSLLNALSERLPKNAEKEDVDLQSGDFDEAFRLLNAFDPRTYGTCSSARACARSRRIRQRSTWACWGFPTRLCPAMIM